jgi:hypothetical protein
MTLPKKVSKTESFQSGLAHKLSLFEGPPRQIGPWRAEKGLSGIPFHKTTKFCALSRMKNSSTRGLDRAQIIIRREGRPVGCDDSEERTNGLGSWHGLRHMRLFWATGRLEAKFVDVLTFCALYDDNSMVYIGSQMAFLPLLKWAYRPRRSAALPSI